MRIATANAYDAGIDSLVRRQGELADLQDKMTSGKRVAKASDDPAAAARAERALASISRSETSQRAVDASKVVMTQTESELGTAGDILQRARELMVSAGNATYSDAERASIAGELRTLRDQLFTIANQSDGAGTYLFGGQGATQKPFVDAPGGVQFAATGGQTRTEAGTNLPLTTDGRAAWLSARTGNGVFVTSAGAGVAGATIDSGQVSDPSALTGSAYSLDFTVSGGVTTYAVLKDGLPTAVTAAPYVSGQAIVVDGMIGRRQRHARRRRPVPDRALDPEPFRLRHARQGDHRPADDRPHRLADRPGDLGEPARHRFGDGHPADGAGRRRRGAEPDRKRDRPARRPEAGEPDGAIERRRCGHGARD